MIVSPQETPNSRGVFLFFSAVKSYASRGFSARNEQLSSEDNGSGNIGILERQAQEMPEFAF
jgi:hypothetical protein